MVGIVAICWAIWLVINKVTFDGHIMRSSMEVVFIMCSFLPYWAGLQTAEVKEKLIHGTKKPMKIDDDV
jgi:hypothetical protein